MVPQCFRPVISLLYSVSTFCFVDVDVDVDVYVHVYGSYIRLVYLTVHFKLDLKDSLSI